MGVRTSLGTLYWMSIPTNAGPYLTVFSLGWTENEKYTNGWRCTSKTKSLRCSRWYCKLFSEIVDVYSGKISNQSLMSKYVWAFYKYLIFPAKCNKEQLEVPGTWTLRCFAWDAGCWEISIGCRSCEGSKHYSTGYYCHTFLNALFIFPNTQFTLPKTDNDYVNVVSGLSWWYILVSCWHYWIEGEAFESTENIMWKTWCTYHTNKCRACPRNIAEVNFFPHQWICLWADRFNTPLICVLYKIIIF